MKQRRLGADGPLVGEVGLGAMSFAGAFGPTDIAESHRALDKALDVGMTHIDTALIYGPYISEEVIGAYLQKNPAARKRFSIATKGGINLDPRGVDNSPAFLRSCLEGSLKRLGVEQVDLYYIHRRDQRIPIEDVVGTLMAFKREGKIAGIGFSEISPGSLERAAAIHPIAAVQSEFSLWTRLPQLGLIQACKRLGTALVAFSPVARGVLTDVVLDPAQFPDRDFRKPMPRFHEPNYSRNMARIERFKAFARARGWATASLAVAWVLHQGDHIIPIPGTRSAGHLADDAAASAISLSPADLEAIEEILPVGFAHGNRYSAQQQADVELYC
ncbi:MAG: aldo/keto reductase [Proteobacteria bacterium]|nr:aldo/keto reductase [Pseudomonadota bacterium]